MKSFSKVSLAVVAVIVMTIPFALNGASKAPEFTLPTAEGTQYSSAAHQGHRIVISFYNSYY